MANFPLAFYDSAESNDYGSTDVTKNLHYNIHNINNQSIFSSDGIFDVYKFKEDTSDGESPERAYSLIVIKNTGAHNSHINVSSIAIAAQMANQNAQFSLVTSHDDINDGNAEHDFGGTGNILTPADYQTVLNGTDFQGTDLTNPEPLGYIKINANSGGINADSFGGNTRYIPFYKPSDIVSNTTDSNGISANNLGGSTTYPRYAAFLLKCDPQNVVNVQASFQDKLSVSCVGFPTVVFKLAVIAHGLADLGYQQGFVDETTNTWVSLNTKEKTTHIVEELFNEADPINSTNAVLDGAPYFDNLNNTAEQNFYFQYVPNNYNANCLAFNVNNQASQNKQWLRIFDNTTNTGGARIIINEGVSMTTFAPHTDNATTTSNQYLSLGVTTNQSVSLYQDSTITDNQTDDTDLSLQFLDATQKLLPNQNFYVKITNNNQNNADNHYKVLQSTGTNLTKLLRPDSSDMSNNAINWRPHIARYTNFFNPFYIDGSAEEVTKKHSIHVLSGAYNVFSTDTATLQRFTPVVATNEEYAVQPGIANTDTKQNLLSRAAGIKIGQLIQGYGVNDNFDGLPKEGEFTTPPQGIGSNEVVGGMLKIYKHHHIFDYFHFKNITSNSSVEFNDILLRFSNLAGTDNCYIENLHFFNDDGVIRFIDSDGIQQYFNAVEHSNAEFEPSGITTVNGDDIATPNRVFSAGFTTGLSYSSYNDNNQKQYLANSTYKDVKLKYEFTPTSVHNSAEIAFNKDAYPHNVPNSLDKLGRKTHIGTTIFKQALLDFVAGATQVSNGNNVISKEVILTSPSITHPFTFSYASLSFIEHKLSLSPSNSSTLAIDDILGTGDWDTSNTQMFITEYSGVNKFGTHDATSSNREAITAEIEASQAQPVVHTTANGTHGMLDKVYGLQHKYASTTRSDDYYFRKYPLNGRMVFKYEKYFNNLDLHQATNSAAGAYGILPGPLAVGNFTNTEQPIKAYQTSKTILSSSNALNTANTSMHEAFISINLKNKGNKKVQLVDVSLENEVGNAETQTFGDPRFILGTGKQAVDSSGVVTAGAGEYYEVPVCDIALNTQKVAPNNNIVKTCSSEGDTTISVNNTTGLKVGQVLIAENETFLPNNGTTIVSINSSANTIVVSHAAADQDDKKVYFDYIASDYVIWNMVKGERRNQTAQLNKFVSDAPLDRFIRPGFNTNGQMDMTNSDDVSLNVNFATSFHLHHGYASSVPTSAAAWVGAYVIPDATNAAGIQPGTKIVSITNATTWVISPPAQNNINNQTRNARVRIVQFDRTKYSREFLDSPGGGFFLGIGKDSLKFKHNEKGNIDRSQIVAGGSIANANATDDSLYANYEEPTDVVNGAPHIYFGANAVKIGQNDIDQAFYYNRLRVKYMVYDKLDFYGVNQEGITENSITGFNTTVSDANKAHVYEDVYLVKINFSNTVAELEVSDLEGDTANTNTVIDFGILSTG